MGVRYFLEIAVNREEESIVRSGSKTEVIRDAARDRIRLLTYRRLRQVRSFDLFLLKLEVNCFKLPVPIYPG